MENSIIGCRRRSRRMRFASIGKLATVLQKASRVEIPFVLPLFFLVLRFSVLSPPLLFYPPPPSLEAAKKAGGNGFRLMLLSSLFHSCSFHFQSSFLPQPYVPWLPTGFLSPLRFLSIFLMFLCFKPFECTVFSAQNVKNLLSTVRFW